MGGLMEPLLKVAAEQAATKATAETEKNLNSKVFATLWKVGA